MISSKLVRGLIPEGSPHTGACVAIGAMLILGAATIASAQAETRSPRDEIARRAGHPFYLENFEFAAVEAIVTGYNLAPAEAGLREVRPYWGEVSLDIVENLGETDVNESSIGDRTVVIDCYPLAGIGGEEKVIESSQIPQGSKFWDELLIGTGDHVLLLLGKSNGPDFASAWWQPYVFGQGKYSVWLVRHIVSTPDGDVVGVKSSIDTPGKVASLPDGVIDPSLLQRQTSVSQFKPEEWKSALRSFIERARQ